jgi:glutamate-1-semialdehyde 2,1-aminomutase
MGMMAGLATLKKMHALNGWSVLEQRTEMFCAELNGFLKTRGYPLVVDHLASIFWLHGWSDKPIRSLQQIPANNATVFRKLFHEALDRKVYLAPSGYEVGFVSMAHTEPILAQALDALKEAIRATYESL